MTNTLACAVALIAGLGLGLGGPALAQIVADPIVGTPGVAAADNGPAVQVTTQQQAQIGAAFAAVATPPQAGIDFDIGVGVVVSNEVTLRPLPAAVVMLIPAYAGYLYFAAPDGRIAVVAPATLEIVLVVRGRASQPD